MMFIIYKNKFPLLEKYRVMPDKKWDWETDQVKWRKTL